MTEDEDYYRDEDVIRDVSQIIAVKLKAAQKIISECESLAQETGTTFHWDLSYGMNGWYDPQEGWQASSQSGC